MSIRLPFCVLLMTALAFAPSVMQAADEVNPNKEPTKPITPTCMMCGKDIGSDGKTITIKVSDDKTSKTITMGCCSQACSDQFMKDPAATLKPQVGKNAPGPKTLYK